MKIFDLFSISTRSLKGRWVALPILGIAISFFCLCFAGAVFTTTGQEKAKPYELVISTDGTKSLSDSDLVKILKIPNVTAATPLLQVSAAVKTGKYSAQLTLIGIEPSYLNNKFSKGSVFPKSSIMPYLVLNLAACKQFSDGKNLAGADSSDTVDTPKIDWTNAKFSLQIGEDGRPIISKVCGILAGDDKEQVSTAYISLSVAKNILQKSGQKTDYVGTNIRIKNIGCAESVSKAMADLGLPAANDNVVLQSKWDIELKEMTYLIVIGIFSLLCSATLIAAYRKISILEHTETCKVLRWVGMKEKDIRRLFMLQALIISSLGVIIGAIVSMSLPSFLSPKIKETSVFALQIPFQMILPNIIICITAGMLATINKKRINRF